MSKKEKAKRDSVFSWNDQSANIRTVTWETGKKLNIKMYERKWKTVKTIMTIRSRVKTVNQNKSSRYVRHLKYSLDKDRTEHVDEKEDEEKRLIARGVKLYFFKLWLSF